MELETRPTRRSRLSRLAAAMIAPVMMIAPVLVTSGCSSLHFDRKYESGVELTKFATFDVKQGSSQDVPTLRLDPVVDGRMREQLNRLFTAKGYSPGADGLTVLYRIEEQTDPRFGEEDRRFQKGTRGSVFPDADPRGRNHQTLALIIEILVPREIGEGTPTDQSKEIVWRGTARGVTSEQIDAGESILLAGDTLLQEFPARTRASK